MRCQRGITEGKEMRKSCLKGYKKATAATSRSVGRGLFKYSFSFVTEGKANTTLDPYIVLGAGTTLHHGYHAM